jgi:DNA-binding response OmpR family regulator
MKILVVDDDLELRSLLTFSLEQAGLQVEAAADGDAALRYWQRDSPDLIVLDVNLPNQSGLEVLERVRAASDLPIIMLTVRDAEDDVVKAFDLGADDYVTKPFSPRQLVARVKAALRRSGAGERERDEIAAGGVRLDLGRHEVTVAGGEPVHLTQLELRLLEVLMSAAGEPLSAQRLIERVWGYEGHLADHSLLKSLVRRVRLKVEPDPRQPRYVRTLPGAGYVFVAEEA